MRATTLNLMITHPRAETHALIRQGEAASVEKFQGLALRVGKGIPAPHTALHGFPMSSSAGPLDARLPQGCACRCGVCAQGCARDRSSGYFAVCAGLDEQIHWEKLAFELAQELAD